MPINQDSANSSGRRTNRLGWFGTSIMEHFQAHNAQLHDQSNLPEIGSMVAVQAWVHRGYVHRVHVGLQVSWPHCDFTMENHGEGGATSRDILAKVKQYQDSGPPSLDVAIFGCGINDVWRGFQGRMIEAVGITEFAMNYRHTVHMLTELSDHVICVGETPFGWDEDSDVTAMNAELTTYNQQAAQVASSLQVPFIDVMPKFTSVANAFASSAEPLSLWSDGVHLSEHGEVLLANLVGEHIHELVSQLTATF